MMLTYNTIQWPNGRPGSRKESTSLAKVGSDGAAAEPFNGKIAYSGQITEHSKKRLRNAINLLVDVSEWKEAPRLKSSGTFRFKLNFVTLTLPAAQGNVTDKEIRKQCLEPWLRTMRRKHSLRSYVWRAERQYNGNLHYHITTDTYLPLHDVQSVWNHQLSKFHFINEFAAKHGHHNPPSTEVHSVQKMDNIAGYMVKYMSKSPEDHLKEINAKRLKKGKVPLDPTKHIFRQREGQPSWDAPIDGKVWDCSLNIKAAGRCQTEICGLVSSEINQFVERKGVRVKQMDHCSVIMPKEASMEDSLPGALGDLWRDYLYRIRKWKRPPKPSRGRHHAPGAPPDREQLKNPDRGGGHPGRMLRIPFPSPYE